MMNIGDVVLAEVMLWLMYAAVAAALVAAGLSVAKTIRQRTKDDEIINGVPQTRIAWTVGGAFILATLKMYGDDSLNYGVLLNSNKALAASSTGVKSNITF